MNGWLIALLVLVGAFLVAAVVWAHIVVFALANERLGLDWWQVVAVLLVFATWTGGHRWRDRQ